MSDSPEMRPDAPHIANEVYMLVVQPREAGPDDPPDTQTVNVVATAYDLNGSPLQGARQVGSDEVGEVFGDFVNAVVDDMMSLTSNTIWAYAEEFKKRVNEEMEQSTSPDDRMARRDHLRATLYVKLLMDMGGKPVELIGNMLANFLVSCIEDTADSPDFDERLAEWKAGQNGDPAAKE